MLHGLALLFNSSGSSGKSLPVSFYTGALLLRTIIISNSLLKVVYLPAMDADVKCVFLSRDPEAMFV
jgi:hypothetical protein